MSDQRTACRVCNSTDVYHKFLINGNEVMRCNQCTHTFLGTRHTQESIKELYDDYASSSKNEGGAGAYFASIDDHVLSNIDDYLATCTSFLKTGNEKPKLLDIGCGNGALISRAQQHGFDVEGVEICLPLAEYVENTYNCTVHKDFLANLNLPDNSYDVVTMYDLLEHLEDPHEELQHIHRILKPGGVVFVLTPNDTAIVRDVARLGYYATAKQLQTPMKTLYYADHLSYFTPQSITTLFEKAQYSICKLETRNQEMSRLNLSPLTKLAVKAVWGLGTLKKYSGGKFIVYSRKEQ